MRACDVKEIFSYISEIMANNKDYLIELDQQNGDGDLGISMSAGFSEVASYLKNTDEKDLGKLFMSCSSKFNEAASSTLGTIISLGMMGMARTLKGKEEANISEVVDALEQGIQRIMDKAKSKPGEKTILDALYPAVEALKANSSRGVKEATKAAYEAAAAGSENTRNMKPVHGRAAYYGDKSIGLLDGGSVAGKFIFEGIYRYYSENYKDDSDK
ncbi:MAG TPA: dihydroxyacetone kinase subunit L [Clostridiaceae bacterium]|nr:dihydroxyacetone kinase subunit L [Clostridiaceae bacterium]